MAGRKMWTAVLVAIAGLVFLGFQLPSANADPVTGNATYFDALGSPYGGCGLPQAELDTQAFVALNVYNTPGDYNFYPRPLTGADVDKIGQWNNGLNCGRWVKVSIGDFCTGVNDGAQNAAFCRNGEWVSDAYNGATLMMQVADSCGDTNAWCRDDPYHLDLAKDSLNTFVKADGSVVGDLLPNHFNNRHISWEYAAAPNYSGDITIGFMQGAQAYWPAIAVGHLADGIHSVEYLSGGSWVAAKMNGDMGQSYILGNLATGVTQFQIRVRDVNDELINGGRVYTFGLPASCGTTCSAAYTETAYTTSEGDGATTAPTTTPTTAPTTTPTTAPTTAATTAPTTAPATTAPTTAPASAACSATSTVTSQWGGGFQSSVTVAAGSTPLTSWTVQWTFANGEQLSSLWSATYTASGSTVTAKNAAWNGTLAANASTTFGFTGSGTPGALTLTCAGA